MQIFAFHSMVLFVKVPQAPLNTDLLRFYVFLILKLTTFKSQVVTNSKLQLFEQFDQKFALLNLKTHIIHIMLKVHFEAKLTFLFLLK